ncbi:MAG: CRISPR-associated endonuclease Cas1 [Deltaproteobacteria bacterium]|nr:CRISPR-associated endonuclease Cas1 [Deltaproteobacteria bacterium]
MGTLYIDKKGVLVKLDGGALAFYDKGEKTGIVPISPLKSVVISSNVIIESSVLKALADHNIMVVFLSGKRMRFSGILRGRIHKNGLLRLKQYEKSLSSFAMEVARDIVRRKLLAQKEFLESLKTERPDKILFLDSSLNTLSKNLETISSAESFENIRGLEGSSSSAYFSAYTQLFPPSLDFKKRVKRPPGDPVNAMLSFLYMRIHYEILREVEMIGFDPTIGFYHQFDYGRDSLACDIVELFRTEVDRFVYKIFKEKHLSLRDFAKDDERPGVYLKKHGRKKLFPLYEDWVGNLRPLFREEVRVLARKVMDGADFVSE